MSKQGTIAISSIRPSATALRKVDKTSPKFHDIVNSIPRYGILNPITVQERVDQETEETYFELVDGLHRYTAAVEAGLEEIPVHFLTDLDEIDTLVVQVHANNARVETKPAEFSKQCVRILQKCPTMTEAELAQKTGFSLSFIRDRLKLSKIEDAEILSLIDAGKISLQNAYALASLPVEEHTAFKEDAIIEPANAFLASVKKRKKEINEARKGARAQNDVFEPTPRLRTLKELKGLLDDKAPVMQFITPDMTAEQAVEATINFVMTMDPASLEEKKAKFDANVQRRKDKAERSAKEKEQKKAQKKLERAAKAKEEAEKAVAEAMGEVSAETETPAAE